MIFNSCRWIRDFFNSVVTLPHSSLVIFWQLLEVIVDLVLTYRLKLRWMVWRAVRCVRLSASFLSPASVISRHLIAKQMGLHVLQSHLLSEIEVNAMKIGKVTNTFSNVYEPGITDSYTASREASKDAYSTHAYNSKLRSMVRRVLRYLMPLAMFLSPASVILWHLIEQKLRNTYTYSRLPVEGEFKAVEVDKMHETFSDVSNLCIGDRVQPDREKWDTQTSFALTRGGEVGQSGE